MPQALMMGVRRPDGMNQFEDDRAGSPVKAVISTRKGLDPLLW